MAASINWLCAAMLCLNTADRATAAATGSELTGGASWPFHTFKTVPFQAPVVDVVHRTTTSRSAGEEFLFFAPDGASPHETAPIIVNASNGDLIWNGPPQHAFAFGVQQYRNESVLVGWNGTVQPEPQGRGYGEILMWDRHYNIIHRTTLSGDFVTTLPGQPKLSSHIDLHEIFITERNTMLVTGNNVTQADLRSVGGSEDDWVVASLFYEIDIASNQVLFTWNSLDHLDAIPFTASLYSLGSEGFSGKNISTAWGYFHINAVAPYDGGYIISSRYTCSAIAVASDGRVKWRVGGRIGGNFTVDEDAKFCYQHDIRPVAPNTSSGHTRDNGKLWLHMHDNHNAPLDYLHVPSSAKTLEVDLHRKHVSLVQEYRNASGPIYSTAQGNMQVLASKERVLVGHGWVPVVEEFAITGEVLSTTRFGYAVTRPGGGFFSASPRNVTLSYRAFKQPWVGCPTKPPDVAVERQSSLTRMYVSWNGATEVVAWEIYAGMSPNTLRLTKVVEKHGFETMIEFKTDAKYVQFFPRMRHGVGDKCICMIIPSSILQVDG